MFQQYYVRYRSRQLRCVKVDLNSVHPTVLFSRKSLNWLAFALIIGARRIDTNVQNQYSVVITSNGPICQWPLFVLSRERASRPRQAPQGPLTPDTIKEGMLNKTIPIMVVDKSAAMAVNSHAHLGLSKMLNNIGFLAELADSAVGPALFIDGKFTRG